MSTTNLLLDVNPNDLLALTAALVDIPSISKEEKLITDYIEEYISIIRPSANVIRINNSVIVQLNHDKNEELPVIFAGHSDTVPPASSGDSANPSRVDGDKLYGLGTSDMKSGLAIMLRLLHNIDEKSTFIFYEGEEISDDFNGLCFLSENNPELLKGKWAILLEPTDGNLEMGCQGSLNANISFKGIAAHSARPHLGDNAIYKSMDTLNKIKTQSENLEILEVDSLSYTESLQITVLHAGNATNVLPDNLTFNLNYRYQPSKTKEAAIGFISDLCKDADVIDIYDVLEGAMPAFDHPLIDLAKSKNIDILAKVAWTDVARFYALSVPALNCGPGLVKMCHRADEHTSITLLDSTYNLLNELVNAD